MIQKSFVTINLVIMITISYVFSAEIPQKIHYQGFLQENGIPVNGNKQITFTFIDTEWAETQTVHLNEGHYHVVLGSIIPIPVSVFQSRFDIQLEISIEGNAFKPLIDIASIAYAFVAEKSHDTQNISGFPVSIRQPENGQVLKWDGSSWSPKFESVSDHLGNHQATKNIALNGNWLSDSGINHGLFVSNGNIGIQTNSPSVTLDVNGSSTIRGQLIVSRQQTDSQLIFQNSQTSADIGFHLFNENKQSIEMGRISVTKQNSYPAMQLFVNKSTIPAITIWDQSNNQKANIGIGVSKPQHRLSVDGDIHFTGKLFQNGIEYCNASNSNGFWSENSNDIYYMTGNVGIGTNHPTTRLAVDGIITAKEVVVTTEGWADYVFDSDYPLMPLDDVNQYIKQHHHLPDVPDENEIRSKGISVGNIQTTLLRKIEELTLYMIQVSKENKLLKQKLTQLETHISGGHHAQ